MPGQGQTEEPKEPMNVDDYVKFVEEFIEKMGIKEIDLIGHSNGGRIIIKLMNNKLNFKVNKIVLIGSAGLIYKKSFKVKSKIRLYKICKTIAGKGIIHKISPKLIDKVNGYFGSEDYKNSTPVMRKTMSLLVNTDLKDELKNVNAPTLLIWGENDTATPISGARIMEKEIPDAGLVEVKGCSHYVFIEAAAYVNRVIKTFIG